MKFFILYSSINLVKADNLSYLNGGESDNPIFFKPTFKIILIRVVEYKIASLK